jgi:hypothetical protein
MAPYRSFFFLAVIPVFQKLSIILASLCDVDLLHSSPFTITMPSPCEREG